MEREDSLPLNGFMFDVRHGELRDASGRRVSLRPQTMAVLQCLARSPDRVVGKDELMQAVWPGVVVTDDSLVQCIKGLRRALGDHEHRVIETEPKRGYRLAARAAAAAPQPATPSEPPFRQQVRFATSADGVRIAYATSGGGPALVRTAHWMSHLEWDWQSAVYGPWIKGFSRRYTHLRYDGRGCGLSDRGVPMATLDDEVRDLEAVVDDAGLERFALLGRSQGGAIAIRYAARHPQRVSHLVLIGGYARGGLRRGDKSLLPERVDAVVRLIEVGWGEDNAAFRQLITSLMFPGANVDQIASFNHMQRLSASAQDAAMLERRKNEYDASAEMARVRCPTLVLHSAEDGVVPFEEGRFVAAHIAGARLETFAGINHSPLPTEPAFEQVNRQIDEFLLAPANVRSIDAAVERARPALRAVTKR